MKILIYSQHILGMGHLARASKLADLLNGNHTVTLMSGGETPTSFTPPEGVSFMEIPSLKSDETYNKLFSASGKTLEKTWEERRECLEQLNAYDVLITELFPFGRIAFTQEIVGLIQHLRLRNPKLRVISSVRDHLSDPLTSSGKEALQKFYQGVLVHGDFELDSKNVFTSKEGLIFGIPFVYTGYLAKRLSLKKEDHFIASVGGGSVDGDLITKIVSSTTTKSGIIFSGPLGKIIDRKPREKFVFHEAVPSLAPLLSRARLSVGLAGHNTLLEAIAGGTFSLTYPLPLGNEQMDRAKMLEKRSFLKILSEQDLMPMRLGKLIDDNFDRKISNDSIHLASRLSLTNQLNKLL